MSNYSDHIDENVLKTWFSSKTIADPQLTRFINTNHLPRIKPSFKDVCNRLFGCDNPYHAYKPELLPAPMPYKAHIGEKTSARSRRSSVASRHSPSKSGASSAAAHRLSVHGCVGTAER